MSTVMIKSDSPPEIFWQQEQGYYVLKIQDEQQILTLTNFVDFSEDERLKVWRWRNHETVRKWMYHPEPFSLKEHLAFIQSLVGRKDKQYFLVKNQDEYLGVIDFVNIDFCQKSCDFGLYANPERVISGTGSLLEMMGIHYAFNVLDLDAINVEAFFDNRRSLGLHKKFGFKVTGKRLLNEKEIISMQLNKEKVI